MIKLFHEVVTNSVGCELLIRFHYSLFILWNTRDGQNAPDSEEPRFRGLRLKENLTRNTLTEATVTEPRRGNILNRHGIHP